MRPLIGITCSTIAATEPERAGMMRFAVPSFYVARVEEAGGIPVVLPSVAPEQAVDYVARVDAVLLSGGPDVDPHAYGAEPHPRLGEVDVTRDRFEIALVKAARTAGLPVFGVCRGMQLANVAFGGSLIQDIPAQVPAAIQHDQTTVDLHQPSHVVTVVPGTQLHGLVAAVTARVNSFHHQAVDRMAEGFRVTARSSDGLLEAMERTDGPWFQCVQWHPERLANDPVTRSLFRAFVEAAQHSPPVSVVPTESGAGDLRPAPVHVTAPGSAPARTRGGKAGLRR
jgi:putative glutamine amidotransferase